MKVFPLVIAALVLLLLVLRHRRFSWELRIGSALLIAGLTLYGSGVVEFPNLEELIRKLGSTLGSWTYLLVGAMAFLETGAFVGLVAPGEFTIILGGVVAGQGKINIVLLIGLVWAAAVAGDVTSYFLGRKLGRAFMVKHGAKIKITEERLEQVEGFFERHGGKTILIGRFVGLVRAIAPFIAGASKMPFRNFLPYDIIGAGLWGSALCILGYVFWQSFDQVAAIAGKGAFALGSVIALVVFGIYAYVYLKRAENRAYLHRRLHELAERPALRPLAAIARPLIRRVLIPIWHWVDGPLRFLWQRITPGELGLELTTLLAVTVVGGFTFFAFMSFVLGGDTLISDFHAHRLALEVHSTTLVDVAKLVTWFGNSIFIWPLVGLTSIYLIVRKHVAEGVALATAMILTVVAVNVTKDLLERPRPRYGLIDVSGWSFPSAHAAYSIALVAIAVALRHAIPALAVRFTIVTVALVAAAAIGLSRVLLGVHYLSDVLAGWGLSAAIFSLCGMVALVVSYLRQNPMAKPDG